MPIIGHKNTPKAKRFSGQANVMGVTKDFGLAGEPTYVELIIIP
ncbi:hypothetical protein QUF58_12245 [Anaerolineales bacterium HSG24]|nr:hypothetical protein [Anaerolineales bacterium HSG24]